MPLLYEQNFSALGSIPLSSLPPADGAINNAAWAKYGGWIGSDDDMRVYAGLLRGVAGGGNHEAYVADKHAPGPTQFSPLGVFTQFYVRATVRIAPGTTVRIGWVGYGVDQSSGEIYGQGTVFGVMGISSTLAIGGAETRALLRHGMSSTPIEETGTLDYLLSVEFSGGVYSYYLNNNLVGVYQGLPASDLTLYASAQVLVDTDNPNGGVLSFGVGDSTPDDPDAPRFWRNLKSAVED